MNRVCSFAVGLNRKKEASSLACVGDKLFVRTAAMGGSVLCAAVSCEALAEIGLISVRASPFHGACVFAC